MIERCAHCETRHLDEACPPMRSCPQCSDEYRGWERRCPPCRAYNRDRKREQRRAAKAKWWAQVNRRADPPRRSVVPVCECGWPCELVRTYRGNSFLKGCRRCLDLDGRTKSDRELIGLLREMGGCASYEAMYEALGATTAKQRNSALQRILRMVRRGRVRKWYNGARNFRGAAADFFLVLPEYCAGPGGTDVAQTTLVGHLGSRGGAE